MEASRLKEYGVHGDQNLTSLLMAEFKTGRKGSLSPEDEKAINSVKELLGEPKRLTWFGSANWKNIYP